MEAAVLEANERCARAPLSPCARAHGLPADTIKRASSKGEIDFNLHVSRVYAALVASEEPNRPYIDKVCMEAAILALRQWKMLPDRVANAHLPLLEGAHRLVEMQEALELICFANESRLHGENARSNVGLRISNLVEMWRKRTPNPWGELRVLPR